MIENVAIQNARTETSLCTEDFFYHLPEELIAQHPSEQRDACRLMTLDRADGRVGHHRGTGNNRADRLGSFAFARLSLFCLFSEII